MIGLRIQDLSFEIANQKWTFVIFNPQLHDLSEM